VKLGLEDRPNPMTKFDVTHPVSSIQPDQPVNPEDPKEEEKKVDENTKEGDTSNIN